MQTHMRTMRALSAVVLVTALAMSTGAASAGDKATIVRGRGGRQVGRIVDGYSGGGVDRKVILDNRGARIGEITKGYSGGGIDRWNVYDRAGDRVGTVEKR